MSYSVSIEIDDNEYEITVTSIYFGQEPKGWDPGAGAEIELDNTVKVWGLVEKEIGPGAFNAIPGVIKKISMDEFLVIYAEHEDLNTEEATPETVRRAAEARLEEYCIEDVRDQVEGDYDDSDV